MTLLYLRWPIQHQISCEDAVAARPDIMATGRSDYPNQVNNVLGFSVHSEEH